MAEQVEKFHNTNVKAIKIAKHVYDNHVKGTKYENSDITFYLPFVLGLINNLKYEKKEEYLNTFIEKSKHLWGKFQTRDDNNLIIVFKIVSETLGKKIDLNAIKAMINDKSIIEEKYRAYIWNTIREQINTAKEYLNNKM